ncbi:hypothetical protein AB0I22_18300 [Streptomyces sp. NPDC050610]|uniref:hypothetical protein n=1 Tax=Streptomyces sp. NPDC050610 TaxID=3157097 RepID=UPI003437F6CC
MILRHAAGARPRRPSAQQGHGFPYADAARPLVRREETPSTGNAAAPRPLVQRGETR